MFDIFSLSDSIADEVLITFVFLLLIFVAESLFVRQNRVEAEPAATLTSNEGDWTKPNMEVAVELGTETEIPAEIVDAILNAPRKMYLGSFEQVLTLLSTLLKNWEPSDSCRAGRAVDVVAKWLVERNPTMPEMHRLLHLIHDFDRHAALRLNRFLLDIFLKYGDSVGWRQFFRDLKRSRKLMVPIMTLILDVVAELESPVHFDLILELLPQWRYEDMQLQPMIQSFINAGIVCKRLKAMEDALLEHLYCSGNTQIKWSNIFQSVVSAYAQTKSFHAAQNFIARARQYGLPGEEVDGLEFRLQYEKTKMNGTRNMEIDHSQRNRSPPPRTHAARQFVPTPLSAGESKTAGFALPTQKEKLRPIRSVRWYTTAISDCGDRGDWTQALQFLDEIAQVGLKADTIAYSAAINACGKARQWERALNLFREMKALCLPLNERVYGACLHACAKAKQWEHALLLLDEMRQKGSGVKPNVYNYGAAMSACEYAREYQRALTLFDRLKLDGLQPNLIVYSLAISACWKAEKDDLAFSLFTEMRMRGIVPNSITYRLLHSGAVKNGNWGRVEELKEDMKLVGIARSDNDKNFLPDVFSRRDTTLSNASTIDPFDQ